MKNTIFSFVLFIISTIAFSQVGIGTMTPNNSAVLELKSTDKGFLMPRITDHTNITAPVAGLQVFDATTNSIWHHDGTVWVEGFGDGKFISGDTTSDAVYTTGNVGVGTTNPTSKLEVNGNIKAKSLQLVTDVTIQIGDNCTVPEKGKIIFNGTNFCSCDGTWEKID